MGTVILMQSPTDTFSQAIASAVRAEVARAGLRVADVIDVLDLSRNTAYGRFRGATPFTGDELSRIADRLGVDVGLFFATPSRGAA